MDEPAVVQLGPAAPLEALIATWREQMRPPVSPTNAEASDPSLYSIGVSLRRKVWGPVRVHLEGVRRVFVVPDGVLGVVPLAALPTRNGHYLLEDGPVIHYLSAERDLATVGSGVAATGRGLLSIGGPSFNDVSSFAAVGSTVRAPATRARVALRGPSPGCAKFRSMRFGILPATRVEAQAVAALWDRYLELEPRSPSITLLGAAATETAFKQRGPGTRILHIATHGFFLGDGCTVPVDGTRSVGGLVSASATQAGRGLTPSKALPDNPLLYSGLALAGANRRALAAASEEDGILTAEEVAALNLDGVEWAVLSACDTGLGTLAAGEGVLGLRRAFQVAGARTVIMSLWSVEDQATRQWMEALYRARLGRRLDTADAVREAGLTMLRERRAKGQSVHPFYWASFVAAGDWR